MEQKIQNPEELIYITRTGLEYKIANMSKGFLKTEIAYINRTQLNTESLPKLKEALRVKSLIIFKFTN